MSSAAQSVRAVLEYLLLIGCVAVAGIDLVGVGWFSPSFTACQETLLTAAPIALLIAAASVFVPKVGRKTLILFAAVIVIALVLNGIVAAKGAGICDPLRIETSIWPFVALMLLALRLGLLTQAESAANGV